MIKEYRTGPGLRWNYEAKTWERVWSGRQSVDLRYVTSATPGGLDHGRFTVISVVGMSSGLAIDEDYERFLRDWQSVKR